MAYEKKKLRGEAINLWIEEMLQDFGPREGGRDYISTILLYPGNGDFGFLFSHEVEAGLCFLWEIHDPEIRSKTYNASYLQFPGL